MEDIFMELTARHIMREKIFIRGFMQMKEATNKIISSGQSGLPVVNDKMDVIGVITEAHVLEAMRDGIDFDDMTAEKIMTTNPKTADISATVNELIKLMLFENYTVIPITHNNRFIGVVSRRTIIDTCLSPYIDNFTSKERKGPFMCDR
jgi:predicted transcriptional regulator